jgi:hypothetical protein
VVLTRFTMACIATLEALFGVLLCTNLKTISPLVLGLSYCTCAWLGLACVHRPVGKPLRMAIVAHPGLIVLTLGVLLAGGYSASEWIDVQFLLATPICMTLLGLWLWACPRAMTSRNHSLRKSQAATRSVSADL